MKDRITLFASSLLIAFALVIVGSLFGFMFVNSVVAQSEKVPSFETVTVIKRTTNYPQDFVQDLKEKWATGSEFRQQFDTQQEAETELARLTLEYIDQHRDDINAKGLQEHFQELEILSIRLVSNWDAEVSRLYGLKLDTLARY